MQLMAFSFKLQLAFAVGWLLACGATVGLRLCAPWSARQRPGQHFGADSFQWEVPSGCHVQGGHGSEMPGYSTD